MAELADELELELEVSAERELPDDQISLLPSSEGFDPLLVAK